MTWEEWERDKALTCDMEVSNEPEFVALARRLDGQPICRRNRWPIGCIQKGVELSGVVSPRRGTWLSLYATCEASPAERP
jgi:hypothetical protein